MEGLDTEAQKIKVELISKAERYDPKVFLAKYTDDQKLLIGGFPNSPGNCREITAGQLKEEAAKHREVILNALQSGSAEELYSAEQDDLFAHEGGWSILSDKPLEFDKIIESEKKDAELKPEPETYPDME